MYPIQVSGDVTIHEASWFTNGPGTVGIVRTSTPYDGTKYYIGTGRGLDEREDVLHIADYGSTFPFEAGNALFRV